MSPALCSRMQGTVPQPGRSGHHCQGTFFSFRLIKRLHSQKLQDLPYWTESYDFPELVHLVL